MIGRSFDGSATLDPSYIDYPDYPDATVGWVKRSGPINHIDYPDTTVGWVKRSGPITPP